MSEVKFLLDPATAARVCDWARTHLERDPHGGGPFGDEYRTSSLYFDTADRDVFHRRDSYGRSKYRIRRYDDQDIVFLERKLRTSAFLNKRRTAMALGELARIGHAGAPWTGSWFDERLTLRDLRPVCQVSYNRLARISAPPSVPLRLTLDTNIRALAAARVGFNASQGRQICENQIVLEMKYPIASPAMLKELIQEFRLIPARASKYRMAADALDLIPEVTAAVEAIEAHGATYA
jgi:hypothetical protein